MSDEATVTVRVPGHLMPDVREQLMMELCIACERAQRRAEDGPGEGFDPAELYKAVEQIQAAVRVMEQVGWASPEDGDPDTEVSAPSWMVGRALGAAVNHAVDGMGPEDAGVLRRAADLAELREAVSA